MFKLCLSILCAVLSLQCVGQNLVPNPSFEQHTACPANGGDILLAAPWFQPLIWGSSTDLFDSCGNSTFNVPNNALGFQAAHTGNAYSGINLFYHNGSGGSLREYIEVGLLDTLEAAKKYCIEFYVSLADTCGYGITSIGVYFSNDSLLYYSNYVNDSACYNDPFTEVISCPTQIVNQGSPIIDKQNWIKLSAEFIANGGECFITIGNFEFNGNSGYTYVGNNPSNPADVLSYYYIDDVSVTCCDPSGTCTLSLPEPPAIPFSIPTLLSTNDVFYIKGADAPVNLTLYDARGRLVYKNEQYINDLPLVSYAEGIYFYVITLADGRTERGKLLIGK